MRVWIGSMMLLLATTGTALAQTRGPSTAQAQAGIVWYGTWAGAEAAARRTGRPILLTSAAPHCHNVSGLW